MPFFSNLGSDSPHFGAALSACAPLCERSLWGLDPQAVFLNHGSYGATPKKVLQAQSVWRERLEAQPVQFMGEELPRALRAAAAELAHFVGAEPENLVFVENATSGVNAVLRSLRFRPEDQIAGPEELFPRRNRPSQALKWPRLYKLQQSILFR